MCRWWKLRWLAGLVSLLRWQLDAADADIELVNKRLDEAQGKCYYPVNAT